MNSMQQEVKNPALYAGALSRMGRGPDTQLLHVTDSEVDALSGLSNIVFNEPLRTNPETGLPEAGMFKRLLPMIAAAAAIYFTGGAAAGAIAGTTAANAGIGATMAGTGLAGFGGHALGQLAADGEIDFGRAALAGGTAALGAGAGQAFGGAGDGGIAADFELAGAGTEAMNPVTGTFFEEAAASMPFPPTPVVPSPAITPALPSSNVLNSDMLSDTFISPGDYVSPAMEPFQAAVPMTRGEQFISDIKTPGEVYDKIKEDPLGEFKKLSQMALFSGAFDEPLPEAPSGPPRTPFTPKDFDFNRRRRNLDVDEDGKVTQEDILHLTENKLPEGQTSRFYTDAEFTENEELNAKEGGLLRLQTGGNIQEAIGALTGGAGASMLPMIAQSVVKPEDEEEESISKGYPVGKAGTAPGMPTTGVAVGGGQPPQPFQTGGPTALELALSDDSGAGGFGTGPGGTAPSSTSTEASLEGNVSTMGQPAGSALGAAFGPLGSIAGSVIGSEISQAANESAAQAAFDKGDTFAAPVGFSNPEGVPNINTTQSFLSHIPVVGNFFDSRAQQTAQNTKAANETLLTEQALTGLPTKEQQLEAEAAQEAEAQEGFNAAMGLASLAMAEEDAPEDTGVPGKGSQESVAQGIASLASQSMDNFVEGAGPGPGSGPSGGGGSGSGGGGGSTGGGHDIGGTEGSQDDDTSDSPDSAGGPSDADAGSDGSWNQGGYLGGVSGRAYGGLLQLAGGGSVPYFEGRVMPTGNPTENGMSDNIPFVIAGRQEGGQMGMQPAVLSPDEYVIPADVVSMLGNGSSNAGANDLDQFINNFRMDKYGRPNQPPEMSGGLSSLA